MSELHEAWNLGTDFRKILKYQISWKFVQWELSCYVRKDGQTDSHDGANNHFSQFSESLEKLIKMKILWFSLLNVYSSDSACTAVWNSKNLLTNKMCLHAFIITVLPISNNFAPKRALIIGSSQRRHCTFIGQKPKFLILFSRILDLRIFLLSHNYNRYLWHKLRLHICLTVHHWCK